MKIIAQEKEMENLYEAKKTEDSIDRFFRKYRIGKKLKLGNAYKTTGIAVVLLVSYLVKLIFTKKSMYMNIATGTHDEGFGKDTVYRILNAPTINWCRIILTVAGEIIEEINELTSESRISVIIFDDSFYGRERSKNVELMANVFDHASKGEKYKKGFRMLTGVWSDGVTTIPLCYRHLSSENKECRYNEINSKIDKRTSGYKARQQSITKGPAVMLEFLSDIAKQGIAAKHVVFDSWFSHPATILGVKKQGFDVVCRLKDTSKIKYLVDGKEKTLKEIYRSNKKRRGLSKYLLSVPVQIYTKEKDKYTEVLDVRIVFIRDRNNKKKWIAMLSTDLSLTEEQVIETYGKRWDIEVFFKMCKSYLKLGKEFQGLSYDCITAHTAIVMIRYMILAVQKRENEDPRTLGELFFSCYDEKMDMQFSEALALILDLLHEVLNDCLFLSEEQIVQLIDSFVSKLPEFLKRRISPKTA